MQVTSFNDNEAYESDKEEQKGNDLKVNGCIYIYILFEKQCLSLKKHTKLILNYYIANYLNKNKY